MSILNPAGVNRWTKALLKKWAQSLEGCFKPLVWGFFGSVLNLSESGGSMALQVESPGAMQVLMCWICIFYQKRDWDVHFWWRQQTACFVAAPLCLQHWYLCQGMCEANILNTLTSCRIASEICPYIERCQNNPESDHPSDRNVEGLIMVIKEALKV